MPNPETNLDCEVFKEDISGPLDERK